MPYTPNAADDTQPIGTVDASTAAAEFRALKTRTNALAATVAALPGGGVSGAALQIAFQWEPAFTSFAGSGRIGSPLTRLGTGRYLFKLVGASPAPNEYRNHVTTLCGDFTGSVNSPLGIMSVRFSGSDIFISTQDPLTGFDRDYAVNMFTWYA